jgi:hypothetical protein
MNKSPNRHCFQKSNYLERKQEVGEDPSEEYLEMFKTLEQNRTEQETDLEWQKDNLEYDLRSTKWICDKVKSSDVYAQNLYAAMCNNAFQKRDVMPILKDEMWSCSWRYAGGIVADMQEKGDYIDWYCTGIGTTEEGFVPESYVTDEINDDLRTLGWNVILDDEEDRV